MTLVEQAAPGATAAESPRLVTETGILIVEGETTTPLGPRIVFANDAAAAMTGYEIESLVGSPIGLIYDRGDLNNLIGKLPAIARRPSYCWMDRILIQNGGRRRTFHWTIRPTYRDNSPARHFTLTIAPIEDSPLAEVQEAKPQAPPPTVPREDTKEDEIRNHIEESRSEALAMTAGGVAHDFKNALQTIKANLELASRESSPSASIQGYLEEAVFALGDAEMLARQMLAFTRHGESPAKVFRLGELIERVSRLCTAGSKIRCRVFIPESLRPVEGDPARIYQVLHNLVINARQAMPNGGILHLTAGNADLEGNNLYSVPPGRYSVVSVKDRGCGMPASVLPHIFEPNFSTKQGGSGFGLASCKAIVERHGGAIRAASKEGVGTEFLVFLPSSEKPQSAPNPLTPPARHQGGPTPRTESGGRILLVEDQPDVAKANKGLLRHIGFDSVCVATGEDALSEYRRSLYSHEPFHAVLLDMTLPGGLNGYDVMHELRKLDPEVTVIATSGYFEEGPTDELIGAGFRAILPKPFSIEELAETVDYVLA